jgi:RNA polymerase sigma-70 factor (ECF subfamily)
MSSGAELLSRLYRSEHTKITTVLCHRFGIRQYEVAEDIVSDTFLKAAETWTENGEPENPAAWLYAVAANKAKDFFKRRHVFDTKVRPAVESATRGEETPFEITDEIIADSRLAMILAVCDPVNPPDAQIALALQILCGFSIEEIADAFLTNRETVKKRLLRSRAILRDRNFSIDPLSENEIIERLPTALRTLYLLFSEGYASQSPSSFIRKELCLEALSLALELTRNATTNTRDANALVALMCYQASRLEARLSEAGEAVLYDDQDRSRWNTELIDKGNYYLVEACVGSDISKYQLEASIAYWHTTDDEHKWERILALYNELLVMEYSPVAALNRAFAYAKVYGYEKGIAETEKMALTDNRYWHALLAHLYAGIDPPAAATHYRQAIDLTKSPVERRTFSKALSTLGV